MTRHVDAIKRHPHKIPALREVQVSGRRFGKGESKLRSPLIADLSIVCFRVDE